ncbi:MAG: hypothetical protein ACKOTH_05690 [Solirubrobacterales bacterium]
MTSADELFRSYTAAFEAGDNPSAAEYLGKLEGPERYALELMIDRYLTHSAPSQPVDLQMLEASRQSAWGKRVRELFGEPGPADLRLAREGQEMTVAELAEKMLATAGVEAPTSEEKDKAADYLGRLEAGQLGRLSRRAWDALTGALGTGMAFPAASRPAYGMAFRLAPPPPRSPGVQEESEQPEDFAEAEVFLHAYATPSPESWDRVDELFLGEE